MQAAYGARVCCFSRVNQSSALEVPNKEGSRRAARDQEWLASGAVSKRLACSQSVLKFEQRLVTANVEDYYTTVIAADGHDIGSHGAGDAAYTRLHWRELVNDFAGVDVYKDDST